MKYCFYGFANTPIFYKKLIKNHFDPKKCFVILPTFQYVSNLKRILGTDNVLYLFENFNKIIKVIDPYDDQLDFDKDGRLNLYEIIASDKGFYNRRNKDLQLRIAKTIFKIYRDYLHATKPDVMIMPDVETVEGLILLGLCQELNIKVCYYVNNRYWDGAFFSTNQHEELPSYFGKYNEDDYALAKSKIADFLEGKKKPNTTTACEGDQSYLAEMNRGGRLMRFLQFAYYRLTLEKFKCDEDNILERIKQNLWKPLYAWRALRSKLIDEKYFLNEKLIQNDAIKKGVFLLQVTPESSIHSLAPYFADQLRAIDMARQSLPPGCILYVKEHPGMKGVREFEFYRQLKRMSGVVLLSTSIPTKEVVEASSIAFTVTGTVGIECYLTGKPCVFFGQNYFSYLGREFKGLKDLKEVVRKDVFNFQDTPFEEKVKEIAKIINVSYGAHLMDPYFNPHVLSDDNIRKFKDSIADHLKRSQS